MKPNRADKVAALKNHYKAMARIRDEWKAGGYQYPPPNYPSFPEICKGLKCEAKTRSGTPCKKDGTDYSNGRCKFHGGASTGPITKVGKTRVSQNAKKQTP